QVDQDADRGAGEHPDVLAVEDQPVVPPALDQAVERVPHAGRELGAGERDDQGPLGLPHAEPRVFVLRPSGHRASRCSGPEQPGTVSPGPTPSHWSRSPRSLPDKSGRDAGHVLIGTSRGAAGREPRRAISHPNRAPDPNYSSTCLPVMMSPSPAIPVVARVIESTTLS